MSYPSTKIILADHDEELRNSLEVFLERLGYDVISTGEAETAYTEIQKEHPAILISGNQLEDMPGIQLVHRLRREYPQIEVILVVDEGDISTGVEGLRLGASDYIHKPVKSEALEVLLKRALDRRDKSFLIQRYRKNYESVNRNKILLQQLFDSVPCYISLQDENFRLTGANKRFKEDFGDYVGSYCYEVYKHRPEPCINCPVAATFHDGEPHQTEEVVTSQSGEQYNVLTWTAPIRDVSGRITQVMEMSTNITQIRKLENHLTSLGLLLGSMSHSIRGLLTALDGGIYRLETGINKGDQERINGALETVKGTIQRIRSMVLDILYYTKDRDLNWTRVNVFDFVNQVVALIRPKTEKYGIAFQYDFHQADAFFEIDAGLLSSALVNILENSIDACIDDRSNDKSFEVIFDITVEQDHVAFEVTDNGIGMDRQMRENLFTLFFSSKGYRGTGLGLFIANQVVEQHGGSIDVTSELGKGSRFRIRVPKVIPKDIKQPKDFEKEDKT
jgi:signal transduction histidine kinase/DNA-binding response OmpR family regulator